MSRGCCHCVYVLWITFQSMALTYFGDSAMAVAHFDPYVSEFEFATQFHPSKNPDCPNGWANEQAQSNAFQRSHFSPLRSQRSPEEGSPVGQEPSIEVRAILVRCPRSEEETDDVLINRNIYNITAGRSQDILDFHGFDRDEPTHHSEVRDCRRKLIITMKFNNIGRTKTQEQFVVIDHVLDPVTMHKSRLLNPFVVKVRQEPVLQLYGLKFQGVVNAEAREEVVSKKSPNYTGCDDVSENPTCGQMIFEGKPIPYSQGFCCSCDPELNVQRQASLLNETSVPPFASIFSKTKNRPIRPFKSPRSVKEYLMDGLAGSEEGSQNKAINDEENPANLAKTIFSTDNNLLLTKDAQDEDADLVNLKNLITMTEKNENLLTPDTGEDTFANHNPMKNRSTSMRNSGRVNLTAELSKLEEDYMHFQRSNMLRTEGRNNKNLGQTGVNLLLSERMQDNISRNHQVHTTTNIYPRQLTALSIDVLFAMKPKQKPTTCYSTSSITICPTEQKWPKSAVKVPTVLNQRLVRVFPFSTEGKFDKIKEQGRRNSVETIFKKFNNDLADQPKNIGILTDIRNAKPNVLQSRLRKMSNVPSSEILEALSADTEVTSGVTENLQRANESTQSFDYLTSRVEGLGNLSSSSSSRNRSQGDAILLSGSLKNQLANWLSYEKRKKSRKGNEIGDGNELEIFEMAISTMTTDNSVNGRSEDELMTVNGVRNPTPARVGPDQNYQFLHGTNNKLWTPSTILRPYRSVTNDNSVSNLGIDQQRSIDKKIEVEFVDISQALKDSADGPKIITGRPNSNSLFEKDNSVIEKFEIILNDIPHVIDDATASPTVVEVKDYLVKPTGGPSVGTDLPETSEHVFTDRFNLEQTKMVPTIRQNLPRKSVEVDKPSNENITNAANHQSVTESTVLKHKEEFSEPVSEIPQNTEHQIVVDRFKLVTNYQELPKGYESTLEESVVTNPTNMSPKMRDLESPEFYWTSINTNDRETVTEFRQTVNSEVVPDRLKSVSSNRETLTGEPIQEVKELMTETASIPTEIVWSKQDPIIKNHKVFQDDVSPVMMIEQLKKELQKDPQRYSGSNKPLPSRLSQSRGVQDHISLLSGQSEVNTELTPAEKVEDSVTNGETLPPDEETTLTTVALNIPTQINVLVITPEKIKYPVSSPVAFRDLETNLDDQSYPVPSKRPNKMLFLLEESSPFSNFHGRSSYKKRYHRRHRRRLSRHKRRPVAMERKVTRDAVPEVNNKHVVNGKSENEDDEHPWYETTINLGNTINPSRIEKPVMKVSTSLVLKNLTRRDIPVYLIDTINDHEQDTKYLKATSSSGKLYVSLSRIPESNNPAKLAGLRVEEIPKLKSHEESKTQTDSNVDDVTSMISILHSQEVLNEVDEMPIFPGTERSRMDTSTDKKVILIGERKIAKRNFLSKSKFRSFYPKSKEVASIADTFQTIERNNKRDDSLNSDENEALIFYDYDLADSAPVASLTVSSTNGHIKSSVDNKTKKEKKLQSRQLVVKRSDSVPQDRYFIGESGTKGFSIHPVHHEIGSTLLNPKIRRSGNVSYDQYQIEPSSGWKAKMELLKLKKHADVLKEYLNWRHDIVPPESHGILGYTTKISITTENEDGTTLSITSTTYSPVNNDVEIPFTTVRNLINDVDINENNGTGTSRSTQHCPFNNADETKKKDTPTSSESRDKASYDNEALTGKILPPCCPTTHKLVTTCPTGHDKNVERLSSLGSKTLPKVPDNREQLSDLKNDLVIISVMEKKLGRSKGGKNSPKIYGIREESVLNKPPHRRHHKSQNNHTVHAAKLPRKTERPVGRHLMSIENLDYKVNDEDDDLVLDDFEDNVNLGSSVDGVTFDNSQDGKELSNRWNNLIGKVIHTNSLDLSEPPKSEKSSLPEIAGDNQYALKQLHFINADKYIKQMAKKIAHGSSINDAKNDMDVFEDKNNAVVGRKLKSLTRKKIARKIRMKVNNEDHAESNNYAQESSAKPVDEDPSGKDFAISLSGKIHVEGGTNGQPMSISFDTSPEILNTNKTTQDDPSDTPDFDNSTNTDPNFLSSIFNIASVPEKMANHSQQVNGTLNSTSSRRQLTNFRSSRANHHQLLRHLAKKAAFTRKSRAADERLPKYRDDRSFDLDDTPEESDSEEYPESPFGDSDFKDDYLPEQINLHLEHSSSDSDRDSNNQISHSNSPEVKVIKIIPVDVSRSSLSQSRRDNWQSQNKEEAKVSKTGFNSPKLEDELVPGAIVKPGKVEPADLPLQDNRDDIQDISQQDLRHSCPLKLESPEGNSNILNALASDRRVSDNKPVKLKVIGLVSMEQPLVKDSSNPNGNHNANFDTIPLIHLKIQEQPDKENLHDDFNRPGNIQSESMGGCPEIKMTKSSQQFPAGGSGSCFDTDKTGDDDKMECGAHQISTNTSKPSYQDASERSGPSKSVRIKNMMAIMEFMKKIKQIISGEGMQNLAETDGRKPVMNLARVVILPIDRSKKISGRPGELDEVTDRLVVIGEGIKHENPHNPGSLDGNQPNIKESNGLGMISDGSDKSKDQDKSFLFFGNDKMTAMKQAAFKDPKYREFPLIDSGQENITDPPNEGFVGQSLIMNSTNSSTVDTNDVSGGDQEPGVKNPHENNDSKEQNVLQNLQIKIDDRLRGWGNASGDTNERQDLTVSPKKERSIPDDNYSLMTKVKRRLRSNLRQPRGQIYRYRSMPNREVSEFGKFRRLSAGKGVTKGKQKKTRRKKKRRRKKTKHKKKKKGKHHRNTEINGKNWWPFGRQLMSLSIEQKLVLDSNSDENQIEEIKIKGKRFVAPFAQRQRRKVHRAKFTNGQNKKTKKRRKHKKKKKKKKKKKGKEHGIIGLRSKRQIRPGGTQVRGGQDCMDRRHPPNVNPAKYLESAHCLRFSDLWYSVYELEAPIMEHTVYLQLFEKHNRADGTAHWEDLTQGSMVRMGTFTRHQRDSKPTIVFTYSGAKTESQNRALNLDPSRQRLLVPSPVSPKKASDYPEVRGGSGEYLVVQSSAISKDGSECDKAGVGFTAFSKQQDRCGRTKSTCLKNQPLAFWRHDMKARESGRPGCYFLSNFASVPTKPIKYNVTGSGSREYLGLEYHSSHVSAIDIQVRTDYNAIVRVGSSGRVTEVHVDSTALEHTVVTVVISNMGLASSPYQPRITDCPTGLPVSWTKAKGIMQVVPPQHDQRVTLDLYGQLLLNEFHCSVEVVNHRGELVAMRRIRVQKMDRCFCVWHCLCACIGSVSGMGCQPMSPEHYHAAGFQGPVPVVTTETSVLINAVKNVLMLSALLVLLLLILGLLKWFIGTFAPAVGRWGLDGLLDGSKIEKYLEPELKCRCIVTDDDGWPVHPDTGQPTVRLCSRKLEFVLNLIFFLTYPIATCCTYFKRSLNSSRQGRCCPDESKMCLINEKGSCPKMICVSTYGDNKNSKLEAEDTRYVMNELKKSQESLDNPKRTKKKYGNKDRSNLSKKSSQKNKSASADIIAKRFVDDLLKSRMVFRNLTEPIGGLNVPSGVTYSLRGYFLNAEDGGYRFITPCPFKQHWLIEANEKRLLKPPESQPSNLFMRSFGTARQVYESNELSLNPKGICINVQYQEDT